jgi:heme oxygenase
MAKSYSKYQQNIIKSYYDNKDAIAIQKLQENVTELYLAEGKKRATVWKRIVGHLEKLGVPQQQIDHLVKSDDATLVAKLLEREMAKSE